jgi:hypothetical protein
MGKSHRVFYCAEFLRFYGLPLHRYSGGVIQLVTLKDV